MANVTRPRFRSQPLVTDLKHSQELSSHRKPKNANETEIATRNKSHSLKNNSVTQRIEKKMKSSSLPGGPLITNTGRYNNHNARLSIDIDEDKRRKKHSFLQNKLRKEQLRHIFKRAVKLAVFCAREAKRHSLRNRWDDAITPFISGLHFHDYEVDDSVLFDPRKFKADKQLRISEETRKILTKVPEERKENELAYAQVALRNIKSIAEYPVRMQQKISKVGQYEKYEAKRVIIRQGHPASCFYFILSGSVVIMVADNSGVSRPVAYLHKGMSFGELAIINRTERQSTVLAKETIELLSIHFKDYRKIFMAGGVKNINDPDHYMFLRSLEYLKGWPVNILVSNPSKCVFHFFKAGEVLVKDSHFSDWIFLIKSGSLKVLKKLRRVKPFESRRKKTKKKEQPSHTPRTKRDVRELRDKQRKFILPEIGIPLREHVEEIDDVEDHVTATKTDELKENSITPSEMNGLILSDKADIITEGPIRQGIVDDQKEEIEQEGPPARAKTSIEVLRSEYISTTGRGSRSAGSLLPHLSVSKSVPVRVVIEDFNDKGVNSSAMRENQNSRKTPKKHKTKQEQEEEEIQQEMNGYQQEIRTIAHDLDAAFKSKDKDDLSPEDLEPEFVHILTLTKGDAFGMSEAILGDQPSLCLISAGAECVMLDKNFYLQHAPDSLLRTMRQECCPYPSQEELQESLQVSVDWEAYKKDTFKKTLNYLNQKKHVKLFGKIY